MTDKEDRREKAKLVLADRLKNLQAAGFLGFEDIVDHLQNTNTLAHCIANLAKAVGFDKIYGDLLGRTAITDSRPAILGTWKKALIGEIALVEELLQYIPDDESPLLFERWLMGTKECATWEQLVNSSPYAVLRACAAEGDLRADEAMADAPEAEVVEEIVVDPSAEETFAEKATADAKIVPAAPPADSGDPYDGK